MNPGADEHQEFINGLITCQARDAAAPPGSRLTPRPICPAARSLQELPHLLQIEVERAVSQQKPRLATLPGGGGVGAPEVFGHHPQSADTVGTMLHLLVDTSTWLDLSKRRDGQRWIVALRVLVHQGEVELIVPPLVIDEYERNRERVEASMTASVAQRFKLIRQDLDDYGGTDTEQALSTIEDLARHAPLIGAMTTRNFDEVLELLRGGRTVEPTESERHAVVERGLVKQAPFHRSRNSIADASLIELYASAVAGVDLAREPHAFVTSNSEDFSLPHGDKRQPHPDIAATFALGGSTYALGVDGLNEVLLAHFGPEIEALFAETDFVEEPRRLDEIVEAETRLFDRVWYHRSLQHEYRLQDANNHVEIEQSRAIAVQGESASRKRATYQVNSVRIRTSNSAC